VLAERAILTDLGVLDDTFARGMLSPGVAIVYRLTRRRPQVVPTLPVTLAGLAARVRWHDARVLAALDSGVQQVAVIGAGYDSRAWRFQRGGVRFFEVDHEATQDDKVRRAPSPGPTYVQADLTEQSAATALLASGFDATQPAMFVLEGVTMYLSEEAVRHQLTELSSASAPGSRLSTDFYPRPQAGTARDQRQRGAQRLARTGSGEHLRLLVDATGAAQLVSACGWEVNEVSGARSAARILVSPTAGLPIEAVNEHKTLLAAATTSRA
jgi:methyltransferase (TIGR00027 family)